MSKLQDETGSEPDSSGKDLASDTTVPGRRRSADGEPHQQASAQGKEPGDASSRPDWSQRSKMTNDSGREALTRVDSATANDAQGFRDYGEGLR